MVEGGRVTAAVAKEVFEKMAVSGREAEQIVAEEGLGQIGGDDELRSVVDRVITANEKAVADYRAARRPPSSSSSARSCARRAAGRTRRRPRR